VKDGLFFRFDIEMKKKHPISFGRPLCNSDLYVIMGQTGRQDIKRWPCAFSICVQDEALRQKKRGKSKIILVFAHTPDLPPRGLSRVVLFLDSWLKK
jgi:hypothetical protein